MNSSLYKRNIVIISDCYGGHNSGARLLADLSKELSSRGYNVSNVSTYQNRSKVMSDFAGPVTANFTRYIARGLSEVIRAIAVPLRAFFFSPNIVFVYAPSIFLVPAGVLAARISRAKCILIQRDLVPQWLVDAQKLRRGGLAERFLLMISRFNYRYVDGVAVQSERDHAILRQQLVANESVIVVPNWRKFERNSSYSHGLGGASARTPSMSRSGSKTPLRILYAGNIGEAQSVTRVIANFLKINRIYPVSIEIYGFGTQLESVRECISTGSETSAISIHSPVDESSLLKLARGFDYGLVCLDERITTGIIPSKIATYLMAGLPLLGVANKNSSLGEFIESKKVGVFLPLLYEEKAFEDEKVCHEVACFLIESTSLFSTEFLFDCVEREFAVAPAVDRLLEMANGSDN